MPPWVRLPLNSPLPRQAAAGQGFQVHVGVVAFVDALGVDGVVKQNPDSVPLVRIQKLPQNRSHGRNASHSRRKPPQAYAPAKVMPMKMNTKIRDTPMSEDTTRFKPTSSPRCSSIWATDTGWEIRFWCEDITEAMIKI